jgi:RND family efflux transporter MFP subunit
MGLLAVGLVIMLAACSERAQPPEPIRAVRTVIVSSGDAGLTHEYAADIRARVESPLSFRVGGKLLARKVNLGDAVKPGQVLAQLDPQDLVLGRDAANAAMIAARVNRDQMGADYKRYIDLHQQGFISAAELERRDNAFKASQAQLDQAKAQFSAQGNQARYAQLVADVAGVVTGVDAEPGMVVAAGTPIVRVAVDGSRDVVFSVPEDKVGALRAAAAVPGALKVKLWGADEVLLNARLREVAAAADPATRTFLVKADAGKIDAKLGQTATVVLTQTKDTSVIKLPLAAVLQQQGKAAVWVLDTVAMTVKPQTVTVAGADGNEVVISAGLSAGQEVVVAGVHVLTPGQKVSRFQPPRAMQQSAAPSAPAR